MRQVTRNNSISKKTESKKKAVSSKFHKSKQHPQYGTSKLEEDFARDFLDKLGLNYKYQFEAKEIGRFYDFIVDDCVIIEINGRYWHGDPRLYEEKDLNSIQRRARRVDEYKEKWALSHGFPIYYIWEDDIRKRPSEVMKMLKDIFYIGEEKKPLHKRSVRTVPRRKTNRKKIEKEI